MKIKADASERQQIISIANVYRASIVDVSPESIMIELTGNINAHELTNIMLDKYGIRIKET
jgi:acetolactate synthase-1/3 small subunit